MIERIQNSVGCGRRALLPINRLPFSIAFKKPVDRRGLDLAQKRLNIERHKPPSSRLSGCMDKGAPCIHQLAPLLEKIAAGICGLCLILQPMRQRRLYNLPGKTCRLSGPIAESRTKAMSCNVGTSHPLQEGRQCHVAQWSIRIRGSGEHQCRSRTRLPQHLDSPGGKRDAVLLAGFHATSRQGPNARPKIDLIPAHTPHFARARCRHHDKLKSAR